MNNQYNLSGANTPDRSSTPTLSSSPSYASLPSLPPAYSPRSSIQLPANEFVARVLSPRIAVVASQDASEVCQVNNLSLANLLKPFGEKIDGRVTPRDSQGLPNPIDNFCVRFVDLNQFEEPDHKLAFKIISEYINAQKFSNPGPKFDEIRTKEDVTKEYIQTNLDTITPWYAEFRSLFFQFTGASEHETFEHPVAVIIAISTSNPDPINTALQLYNTSAGTPALVFERGFVDPNILKYYVLIHDGHRNRLEDSEALFEKMKKTFGLHCHLLKLNSIPTAPSDIHTLSDENDPLSTQHFSGSPSTSDISNVWTQTMTETSHIQSRLSAIMEQHQAALTDKFALPHSRPSSIHSVNSLSIVTPIQSPTVEHSEYSLFRDPQDRISNIEKPLDSSTGLSLSSEGVPQMDAQYGRFLSGEDVEGLRSFAKEMVAQSVIPYMERNIQHWNEQVASAKRGLTGRLFGASRRFFGTSATTQAKQIWQMIPAYGPNAVGGTVLIYPYVTAEAQLRKLADYSFMLRDYKFAHSIYELIRRDYATDKAWKYHAGTQEMIGVCLLIAPTPLNNKVDVDRDFELAISAYLNRCKSPFYATRATLLYYEMLKFRRMYREAPTALVRMTGEDSDLRSALLLEQAAHCFLRAPRSMVRKYAFHLIMAGHRYSKCGQREHAFRCYLTASHVFANHDWSLAEDHIHFALGRQSFHLSDVDGAIKFFLTLLKESKQPVQQQTIYLREFLHVYKSYANRHGFDPLIDTLPGLPIPIVKDSSVKVVLSNFHARNSSDNEEPWIALEKELSEDDARSGFGGGLKKAENMDGRVLCAVGEPATVHIEVHNPLQVSFILNEVMLACEHRSSTEISEKEVESENLKMPSASRNNMLSTSNLFTSDAFDLEKLPAVVLEASEKKTLSLQIIPRKEGSIRVLGFHYILNNQVHSFRPFHKKGKRLNDTKEQRMNKVYAPDRSLDLLVTSPMPLLDISFHPFPDTLFSGEVTQAVLEINNKGEKGLTDLRVKMSHPSFFCVGDAEILEDPIYDHDTLSSNTFKNVRVSNSLFNPSIIQIPLPGNLSKKNLAPGASTHVPVWVRGDRERNKVISYRTLRYSVTMQVLPSLRINVFTKPSTKGMNEFILGVETENLQTTAEFNVIQLSATSPSWEVTPLSLKTNLSDDLSSKLSIPPRQTTFTYFRIRKIKALIQRNNQMISPELWTSNALEKLLLGVDFKQPKPDDIDLCITTLSFSDYSIPKHEMPLRPFFLTSRMQWRSGNLSTQFPNIPPGRQQKYFTFYGSDDIDLILYWNIPSMKKHGHHFIIGINLAVQQNPLQGKTFGAVARAMYEQTASERAALLSALTKNKAFKDESPVKFVVDSEDNYRHDFAKEKLLVVPITISIKNCSYNRGIAYSLEMLSAEQARDQLQNRGPIVQSNVNVFPFHWSGPTLHTGILQPDKTFSIVVHVCFQQAGVYDVNRWRLNTNFLEESATARGRSFVQVANLPKIVTIENAL